MGIFHIELKLMMPWECIDDWKFGRWILCPGKMGGHTPKILRAWIFVQTWWDFVKIMTRGLLSESQSFSPIGQKLESQESQAWLPFLHDALLPIEWDCENPRVKLILFELEASRNIKSSWNFAHMFISCLQWVVQRLVSIRHKIRSGDSEVEGLNQIFASCR